MIADSGIFGIVVLILGVGALAAHIGALVTGRRRLFGVGAMLTAATLCFGLAGTGFGLYEALGVISKDPALLGRALAIALSTTALGGLMAGMGTLVGMGAYLKTANAN